MKASMRRGPQRGPAISGNGVMCQGDPDVSRVLEADRSLPHQVEVYAASAQFGEIPPHQPNSVSNSIRTGIIRSPPTRRAYQIFPRL